MKTIEAYKCNFCNKVYQLKKSCQAHENRCYKNRETKSCASCIFLKEAYFPYHHGYSVSLLTCLRNHNTPQRLETGCVDYKYKKEKCDYNTMAEIRATYNPEPFVQPFIEKHKAEHERRMMENTLVDVEVMEQFFDAPF